MDFWYEPDANPDPTYKIEDEWNEFHYQTQGIVDECELLNSTTSTFGNSEILKIWTRNSTLTFDNRGYVDIGVGGDERDILNPEEIHPVSLTIPNARVHYRTGEIMIWDNDQPVTGDLLDDEWWEENRPEVPESEIENQRELVREGTLDRYVQGNILEENRTEFRWKIPMTEQEQNRINH